MGFFISALSSFWTHQHSFVITITIYGVGKRTDKKGAKGLNHN